MEVQDGAVERECLMYLMDGQLHLIIVLYEWLQALLLPFLDLVNCKPLVLSERLLSPGVSVCMRSICKNSLRMQHN